VARSVPIPRPRVDTLPLRLKTPSLARRYVTISLPLLRLLMAKAAPSPELLGDGAPAAAPDPGACAIVVAPKSMTSSAPKTSLFTRLTICLAPS